MCLYLPPSGAGSELAIKRTTAIAIGDKESDEGVGRLTVCSEEDEIDTCSLSSSEDGIDTETESAEDTSESGASTPIRDLPIDAYARPYVFVVS